MLMEYLRTNKKAKSKYYNETYSSVKIGGKKINIKPIVSLDLPEENLKYEELSYIDNEYASKIYEAIRPLEEHNDYDDLKYVLEIYLDIKENNFWTNRNEIVNDYYTLISFIHENINRVICIKGFSKHSIYHFIKLMNELKGTNVNLIKSLSISYLK